MLPLTYSLLLGESIDTSTTYILTSYTKLLELAMAEVQVFDHSDQPRDEEFVHALMLTSAKLRMHNVMIRLLANHPSTLLARRAGVMNDKERSLFGLMMVGGPVAVERIKGNTGSVFIRSSLNLLIPEDTLYAVRYDGHTNLKDIDFTEFLHTMLRMIHNKNPLYRIEVPEAVVVCEFVQKKIEAMR